MDLNRLSGLGAGSRLNMGKLTSSISSATRYGLRDKGQSLTKIIKDSAGSIRSGKFSSQAAWEKFRSVEKDMSYKDRNDARQILKHIEKSASEAVEQRASGLGHHVSHAVKEDEGFRVDRAAVLRARRAYEQMQQGGSKEMQKKTFAQLKEAEGKLDAKEGSVPGAPAGQSRPGVAGPAGGSSPYRSAGASGNPFKL